jgi:hypothetical protein
VVDGGDQERLAASFRVERVVELEFRGVTGAEMVELLGGLGLRPVDLIRRLGAERFQFLLVCFRLASAYISAQPGAHHDARAFFWFHEDFEIGLGIRLVADFGQQERIDVATRGDEIQIAANAGLSRVDIAKVMRAVDDPEFFVAGSEIENLLVLG